MFWTQDGEHSNFTLLSQFKGVEFQGGWDLACDSEFTDYSYSPLHSWFLWIFSFSQVINQNVNQYSAKEKFFSHPLDHTEDDKTRQGRFSVTPAVYLCLLFMRIIFTACLRPIQMVLSYFLLKWCSGLSTAFGFPHAETLYFDHVPSPNLNSSQILPISLPKQL